MADPLTIVATTFGIVATALGITAHLRGQHAPRETVVPPGPSPSMPSIHDTADATLRAEIEELKRRMEGSELRGQAWREEVIRKLAIIETQARIARGGGGRESS